MNSVITVSRYWNNPKITTSVSAEGISISMDMEDFKNILNQEIGYVMTKSKLDKSVEMILERMKEESIKVM